MNAHITTIANLSDAYGEPCVTWERGSLTGSIPHIPLPAARIGRTTWVECVRCDKALYTYQDEPLATAS